MVKKILLTFFIILVVTIFIHPANYVNATSVSNIIQDADNFITDGGDGDKISAIKMQETSSIIYNILLIIGICIAVIIGTILGIQFITGSVEQKVKVKESIIPFVVGCIVIFGAFGIWRLVILVLG